MDETTSPTHKEQHHQSFWLWVMCLTGVDYFSTLGYQPSIAFENTGRLAPLATVLLVLMTLFGALPVYRYVAAKSPHGQGSIAMLERLVPGWSGKIFVLVLLGFAGTDFVITKTLSAADAAEHLIANPLWPWKAETFTQVDGQRLFVTMFLLVLLGALFLRGFREVIGLAIVIVGVYLTLNAIVIGSGLVHLLEHPERFTQWIDHLEAGAEHWHVESNPLVGDDWLTIGLLCLLFFPKLALGLSGFETGVAVMPLVRGSADDDPAEPRQRIRNTRKLMTTAAIIMCFYLLGSSLVVSTLIEPGQMIDLEGTGIKPPAKDRALAYLAHGQGIPLNPLFGETFGTIYDIATVVILAFAGASAMAALLNLVPQYLPRYGMAPEWATAIRPLVILFTVINLIVTWVFNASVTAQGGAYATGVLVLMSSACVATVIGRYRANEGAWLRRVPWGFVFISLVFFYTTAAIAIEKPDGLKIASCFIVAILASSLLSRARRSTELRFSGFQFADPQSQFLWQSMEHLEFPVLVPHRPGRRDLASKEQDIRQEHRLGPEIPIVFIEADLGDVSEFWQQPVLEVLQEEGRFVLHVSRCASIPHVIAAIGLEMCRHGTPPEIHFGWSDESPLTTSIGFLLFGEGNVPWLVRELVRRAEPDPSRQPRVIIG
ncbi:MAG: amino acid transporter [Gemmataceae bacterium]